MNKILVRAPNWIGDQILAYPFFYWLRKLNPKAKITVAARSTVSILQYTNLVDRTIDLPPDPDKTLAAKVGNLLRNRRLLKSQKEQWDEAYLLTDSLSAAALFKGFSKKTKGFDGELRRTIFRGPGYTWIESSSHSEHRSEKYLKLLSLDPGQIKNSTWKVERSIDLDEGEALGGTLSPVRAQELWQKKALCPENLILKSPFLVVGPGSNASSRTWPHERFADLIGQIFKRTEFSIVLAGGPAEAPLCEKIYKRIESRWLTEPQEKEQLEKRLHLWSGAFSLPQWGSILEKSRGYIGNDSGLAHLSSFLGVKTWVIWGAGEPKETSPRGPIPVDLIFNPVECWPCRRNQCENPKQGELACLAGITVDQVLERILKKEADGRFVLR